MEDAPKIWRELREVEGEARELDLSGVTELAGNVAALIAALRADLAAKGSSLEIVGVPEQFAPLVDLYGGNDEPPKVKKRKPESMVAQVGRVTLGYVDEVKQVLGFFGEMVLAAGALVRHPRSAHWREVPPLAEKTGADAVPIVGLINFLVGFVMAYQAAKQLKMFGANIYVADLVGLSVTRELGPLMTAIIVCGRSGAAFAAEIGTMKVGEEIDALRTFGLRPFGWLVVPRVLALLFVVPVLTLLADVVGIAGGLFVGVTSLDLTVYGYFTPEKVKTQLTSAAPDAARPAAGLPIELGRVTSASHIREKMAFRDASWEVGYYEDRRWTERPEAFVRREIGRTLFEERGFRRSVSAANAPVLEIELIAFEEIRAKPIHVARVQLRVILHDGRDVLHEETLTVDKPLPSGEASVDVVVSATADALDAAAALVADRAQKVVEAHSGQ